jgi:TPP-dependent pyruvate/acetoin dehydrogenase alpha subunit
MNDIYNPEIAKQILRVRLSQMIINEKCKKNEFKIPIHLAFGHEAIAVAVDQVMGKDDQLTLTHRNIHYNLAKSGLLKPELDEYSLKKEGMGKGLLGSMNLANEKEGLVYTSSILGNDFSVACGLALGQKVKKQKGVVFVVGGDGSIEEGSFYESLLFLKSNKLSSLIIIENNKWSLATEIKQRRCDIDLQKFGDSLDIKYQKLSGNDPYEYIEKLTTLKKEALENSVPIIIEVEIITLGGWNLEGRFINYHAGAAPEINLSDWPLIESSNNDPVFVLQKHFPETELRELSKEILNNLNNEIR